MKIKLITVVRGNPKIKAPNVGFPRWANVTTLAIIIPPTIDLSINSISLLLEFFFLVAFETCISYPLHQFLIPQRIDSIFPPLFKNSCTASSASLRSFVDFSVGWRVILISLSSISGYHIFIVVYYKLFTKIQNPPNRWVLVP